MNPAVTKVTRAGLVLVSKPIDQGGDIGGGAH